MIKILSYLGSANPWNSMPGGLVPCFSGFLYSRLSLGPSFLADNHFGLSLLQAGK